MGPHLLILLATDTIQFLCDPVWLSSWTAGLGSAYNLGLTFHSALDHYWVTHSWPNLLHRAVVRINRSTGEQRKPFRISIGENSGV